DITQDDGEELLASDLDLRDRRLDGELLAVPAEAAQSAQEAHRACRDSGGSELLDVARMAAAKSGGDELVEGLADRLVSGAAEHPLGRQVEEHDVLVVADGDDRIHRRVDDARQPRLALEEGRGRPPAFRDITQDDGEELLARHLDLRDRSLDGEL